MHWSPAFLPLDPPVVLGAGDTITVKIDRPPFGEWTWRAAWPGGSQRHSTMRDYLSLAAGIRVFRISFKKSFSDFGSVLDHIEAHACRHGVTLGKGTPPSAADTGAAIAPGQ